MYRHVMKNSVFKPRQFVPCSIVPRLEPRNAWMSQLCVVSESRIEKENTLDSSQQLCANITARVHLSPKTHREVAR